MSKVALATAIGLLLFFTYLTGIRPAYAFAYGLCLLFVIAWVWPLTLAIFALQATYAVGKRLVTPFIGLPIAAYDLIVAASAIVRYEAYSGRDPSMAALAITAAQSSALGLMLGRLALFSPFAVQLPFLAPAYPARWRISATVRGTLAVLALAFTIVFAAQAVSCWIEH